MPSFFGLSTISGKVVEKSRRGGTLIVKNLDDLATKPVEWLWRNRIPLNAVTILDGDPDHGKSTIGLTLAAYLSKGDPMPFEDERGVSAETVIFSAEDDPERTIRPRFEAAGGDSSKISIITGIADSDGSRPVFLPADLDQIERKISDRDAKLVIVDPLAAYLDANINPNSDAAVRRVLHRLREIAERNGIAILCIRHLNKKSDQQAMYRGGGSIGIIGAARSGLLVGNDPEVPDVRVLAVNKLNLGVAPQAIRYRIDSVGLDVGGSVGRIVWIDECDLGPDEILQPPKRKKKLELAEDFLRSVLKDGPPNWFPKSTRRLLILESPRRRSNEQRKILMIESKRDGFGDSGAWKWELTTTDTEDGRVEY